MQERAVIYKDIPRYQHVERLSNETSAILLGTVWIQEKLDGANISVAWDDPNNDFIICSRDNLVYQNGNITNRAFTAAIEYIKNTPGFKRFFLDEGRNGYILRGEFLKKHSIAFKEQFQNKVIIFDIECYDGSMATPSFIKMTLDQYPDIIYLKAQEFTNPKIEELHALIDLPSEFMEYREGIVLKNFDYIGHRSGRLQWAKVVNPKFNNKPLKTTRVIPEGSLEQEFVQKFVTKQFVEKEIFKIRDEKGDVTIKDMGLIVGRIPFTIFQEEMWHFLMKHKIGVFNFSLWRSLATESVRNHAFEIIGSISLPVLTT